VLDYRIDNRFDHSILAIFTVGGASREIPWLMKAFVQIAGRDTHFFGDINKIKALWHENIKFYDLNNYFDGLSLELLSNSWLDDKTRAEIASKSSDVETQKVVLTYEVAQKFLEELQNIKF
jgi:hypothetical protein